MRKFTICGPRVIVARLLCGLSVIGWRNDSAKIISASGVTVFSQASIFLSILLMMTKHQMLPEPDSVSHEIQSPMMLSKEAIYLDPSPLTSG